VTNHRNDAAQAHAERLRSMLKGLQERGLSQREIAAELNKLSVPAPRGGVWHLVTVQRVLDRLA